MNIVYALMLATVGILAAVCYVWDMVNRFRKKESGPIVSLVSTMVMIVGLLVLLYRVFLL